MSETRKGRRAFMRSALGGCAAGALSLATVVPLPWSAQGVVIADSRPVPPAETSLTPDTAGGEDSPLEGGSPTTDPEEQGDEDPDKPVDVPKPPKDVVGPEKPDKPNKNAPPRGTAPDEPVDEAEQPPSLDSRLTGREPGGTADDSSPTTPDQGQMAEISAAYSEALEELYSARSDLQGARLRLKEAKSELRKSQQAFAQATDELADARAVERDAEKQMAALERDLERARDLLGQVARDAYSSGGSLASVGVLLQATTPADFARRYAEVKTVIRAGDDALAEISGRLAGAAEAEQWYHGVREIRRELQAKAEAELDRRQTAARLARLAAAQSSDVLQRREAAFDVLRTARSDELAKYRAYASSAEAVGTTIVDISGQLTGTGVPGTGEFVLPGYGGVTSQFGPRFHPILRYTRMHTGVDFAPGDGMTYAVDRGIVTIAGYNSGYGNVVVVDHGSVGGHRLTTLYAHHSSLLVSAGDVVRKGEAIGLVGSTGYSTGPHLHFEVRLDGVALDPMPYLVDALPPKEFRSSRG